MAEVTVNLSSFDKTESTGTSSTAEIESDDPIIEKIIEVKKLFFIFLCGILIYYFKHSINQYIYPIRTIFDIGRNKVDEPKRIFSILDNADEAQYFSKKSKAQLQYLLGYCSRVGYGTEKDEHKAFELYLKSAENGNAKGQCELGHCFEVGIGIKKDENKAFKWYLKSAENGYNKGQYELGRCFEDGIGIKQDENKAFKCYLKSAENGYDKGHDALGRCFGVGIGIEQDLHKALNNKYLPLLLLIPSNYIVISG